MIFFIIWRKKELTDFLKALEDSTKRAIKKHEKKYHSEDIIVKGGE